jgi:NitT/TauT family transport system permease protein
VARRLAAFGLLLIVWEVAARVGWLDPFYAPAPSVVAGVMRTLFADPTFWMHLQATFTAAFVGLLGGLVLGIVLGFAAALSPVVADVLEPVMVLLNAIPRVILAPLFVIWLGIDLASKIALALILVAVLIFFAVYSGIKEVDQRLVERVRTLGGGRRVLVREVYVPRSRRGSWAASRSRSASRSRGPWSGSSSRRVEGSAISSSSRRAPTTRA